MAIPSTSTSSSLPSAPSRPHLDKLFAKVDPVRGKLIFAVDATASLQPTWDVAAKLTSEMFNAAAATGGLDVQLVYYRGISECVASRWFSDARSLSTIMSGVMCRSGETQIGKVLAHARKEHQRRKIDGVVLITDTCEENPNELYAAARELENVPVFLFQEGEEKHVTEIFARIAEITGGAVAKFDISAAARLAELLKAVAVFAAGGIKALANENSEAARLLLTQIRKQ
jgi:hypothetical protein